MKELFDGLARIGMGLIFPFLKYDAIAGRDYFSWQSAMTFVATGIFAALNVGYAFFGAREVPVPYWATIAGVFTAYFGKGIIDRISIAKAEPAAFTQTQP